MSIASVVTRGYGTWGAIEDVPVRGYTIGEGSQITIVSHYHTLEGTSQELLTLSGPSIEFRSLVGPSQELLELKGPL